jgi:Dimerisation domain
MTTSAPVTPERIMQFAWGYVPPLVLEAAIRHRVFDVLDGGPKTIAQVQKETGASERGLTAVMHALVGMDFLAKDKQGLFSLTPESSTFLVSTKPSFQGGFIRHASEQLIPKWLHLNKIVETGRPETAVNLEGAGSDFFQRFVVDIFPMSYPAAQALSRHLSCRPGPCTRLGRGLRSLEYSARAGLGKGDCHRRGLAGGHSHHPENGRQIRSGRALLIHRRRPAAG